ncbi:MAG: chromosomal replication initiator DnaA [Pseudooceanicola sp.]
MPRQLTFDLPARPALGRDDFFVAAPNAMAVAMVDQWPDWPGGKLLLTGPEGAGKTHLVHVWAQRSGARILPAADLPGADIPLLGGQPVAVEDAQRIAGDRAAEEALFHLHNHVLAEGHSLLVTADAPPIRWGLVLPDLASRMQGAASVGIGAPDDALLSVVLAKLFADRQIVPPGDVIPYLLRRIDRSFASARRIVAAIDAVSLREKRGITRPLAARICDELEKDGR